MIRLGILSDYWHPAYRAIVPRYNPATILAGMEALAIHPRHATPSEVDRLTRFCQEEEPKF